MRLGLGSWIDNYTCSVLTCSDTMSVANSCNSTGAPVGALLKALQTTFRHCHFHFRFDRHAMGHSRSPNTIQHVRWYEHVIDTQIHLPYLGYKLIAIDPVMIL